MLRRLSSSSTLRLDNLAELVVDNNKKPILATQLAVCGELKGLQSLKIKGALGMPTPLQDFNDVLPWTLFLGESCICWSQFHTQFSNTFFAHINQIHLEGKTNLSSTPNRFFRLVRVRFSDNLFPD